MSDPPIPRVYYGSADAEPAAWQDAAPEADADDSLLGATDPDVIEQLGFDPKDLSEAPEDEAAATLKRAVDELRAALIPPVG